MKLWEAAKAGDEAALRTLLDSGLDPNDPGQADQPARRTGLHLAAAGNHALLIELLALHGAAIDAECSSRRTPLHVAASCGSVEAARVLLEHGARMDIKDEWGSSPMECARTQQMKELLLPHKVDPATLAQIPSPQPAPAPESERTNEPIMDLAAAQMKLLEVSK